MSHDSLDLARRFWGAFNDRDLTGLEHLFAAGLMRQMAIGPGA